MKRVISVILVFALLVSMTACGAKESVATEATVLVTEATQAVLDTIETTAVVETDAATEAAVIPQETVEVAIGEEAMPEFTGLDDTALLSYMEDTVYSELVASLNSEEYFVENVSAVYISKEYLEELSYNSQENIFFGYTLSEVDACFEGTRYVFTLGENGQTVVQPFEGYDDTYEQVLKNVAIGSGVILLCVTVSVVTAGAGAPAVSMIFAASAKTGLTMGLSSGAFGAIGAGIVTGVQTGDFDEAMKAAALAGSEGFKWGVISGAISGGATEAVALKGATMNGLTMNQAAIIQKESNYPLDVIKQFSNMEQYQICQNAGLSPHMVNGNTALIRNIDLNFVDDLGRTNLQRMQQGLAPLDPTGVSYELHHIGQHADSTLAILTKAEHMQGGNNKIWHILGEATEVHGAGNTWDLQRQQFWKQLAKIMTGGSV